MTDHEITQIMVAIGKVETKVDALLQETSMLFKKAAENRSDIDKLMQAHLDRTSSSPDCNPINVITNKQTKWTAVANSAGGIFGFVSMITLLLVLYKVGLL